MVGRAGSPVSGVGGREARVSETRRYDDGMTARLRVLVEQPTRGKRWVAVAADWPGLERGGKTEDEALDRIARYLPRYVPVAKRVGLEAELASQSDPDVIGRYPGVGLDRLLGNLLRALTARP
jgi:hypothetical protein